MARFSCFWADEAPSISSKGKTFISILIPRMSLPTGGNRFFFTNAVFLSAVVQSLHQSSTMEALSKPSGGDQNRGPELDAVAATFCALACISVLSRLFVRMKMIHAVGWDDATICLTMVGNNPLGYRSSSMK